MRKVHFKADEVSFQEEAESHLLAFYNDDNYLFLQRHAEVGHKEDEGLYLEYKAELHCGFDVVEAIEFSAKTIVITLKSCLYQLPDVMTFEIALQLSDDEFSSYLERLRAMAAERQITVTVLS